MLRKAESLNTWKKQGKVRWVEKICFVPSNFSLFRANRGPLSIRVQADSVLRSGVPHTSKPCSHAKYRQRFAREHGALASAGSSESTAIYQ